MRNIWIITLFPEYFTPFVSCGVVGKFLQGERGPLVKLHVVNLRDYSTNKYKSVDDYPYGGGPGMVLRADILQSALWQGVVRPSLNASAATAEANDLERHLRDKLWVICPSPRGQTWNHQQCQDLAQQWFLSPSTPEGGKDLVFICGRYEGLDERFIQKYVNSEICIGDYILSGGELAVMVILDSLLRYVPGVLGHEKGPFQESFVDDLLEAPHYTRPAVFEGQEVPPVLLSGHHQEIEKYRLKERWRLTQNHRPDLWARVKGDNDEC